MALSLFSRWVLLVVLGACFGTGSMAWSAGDPERDRLAASLESADIETADSEVGRTLLAAGDDALAEFTRFSAAHSSLKAERTRWPARRVELARELEADPEQVLASWATHLPKSADVETLERLLAQERAAQDAVQAEADRLADELASLWSAPTGIAGEIGRLQQALEDFTELTAPDATEPAVITRLRAWRYDMQRRALQAELALRILEQDTQSERQATAELELREKQRRLLVHDLRIQHLQSRIVARGDADLQRLMQTLEDDVRATSLEGARDGAPERAADAAAVTARMNLALARELQDQRRLLLEARSSLPVLQQARDQVEQSLRASRARIELGGSSEAVGRWLWGERRRLATPARLNKELDTLRGNLAEIRLREVTLVERRHASMELDTETAQQDESGVLQSLDSRRNRIEDDLRSVLQRRALALEQSDRILSDQLAQTIEMQALLDRHLLWTRSHGAMNGDWFDRATGDIGDLLQGDRYAKTGALVMQNMREYPWRWILALLTLGSLLLLRQRATRRIEAESQVTRHIRQDSYRATARALAWTFIAALPFPVGFALAGLLLRTVGLPGNFSDSVGVGLLSVAAPFFFTQLLRFSAIERGLGHAHFRWRRARRESLRRWMPAFNWIVLPLWFVVAMSVARNVDLAADVSARLAVIAASLFIAAGCWKLFAPGQVWVVRDVEVEPSTWRKIVRVFCTLLPAAIALLAVVGWVHSSSVLLEAILKSFSAAVVIAIAVGMLSRWTLLGERRLAYKRSLEHREHGENTAPAVNEAEGEVTLQQINEQTGRLVRALRIALIAVSLVWVWSDVLPAISKLDDFALWHVSVTVEGGSTTEIPVSAMDVLAGVFVLLLTWAGARNLPGLVEIGLLQRTRIDAPTRYAITSLLRYAIVIAGMLVGLGMLGMRWGQLQWMAAALTVGLGFGLQEIFANFVSGLILLFERPFRVGDIITVGEYTGSVNRIRTRATTIVDFDNREIVVPNKNFITGQLTNWTLTDSVTRLTIRIGVDYGTEPAVVHRLLLQAASQVPEVMKEPEPRTWFLSFGASSLDFELRVFVASVNDRLVVQNALHTRINELLLEAGIDIAYPHLNVNLLQKT